MTRNEEDGVFAPLRNAIQATHENLGNSLQWLNNEAQHHVSEAQRHVGRAVQNLGRHIAVQQRQRQGSLSMLAVCLSTNFSNRRQNQSQL